MPQEFNFQHCSEIVGITQGKRVSYSCLFKLKTIVKNGPHEMVQLNIKIALVSPGLKTQD